MKVISFEKNKESIKYYILALVCVLCVYSYKISELFIPLYEKIYYGNLVNIFVNAGSLIIWLIEFLAMFFVCKKLKIQIFTKPENKQELSILRLIILFAVAVVPMFIVSAYLNFNVKIVYDLGSRVTILQLGSNIANMASWLVRMVFIVLFINFVHLAIEGNVKFSKPALNKYFPWGCILSFLIFGLIDFFAISVNLPWFYLLLSFYYGIVYLLSGRKFASTYLISYLIWLL